jgi:hypothetical protein
MSVSQEQSTDDKGYTDTDTGDWLSAWTRSGGTWWLTTEDPLNSSVSLSDTLSLGGSGGVRDDGGVWASINFHGEGSIGETSVELDWHPLVPDGSGNDISKGTSQVVEGKVETGNNGDIYSSVFAQIKHIIDSLLCLVRAWTEAIAG